MGRVLNDPDEDEWRIRFLTDGRSQKAADMRRASEVTILFQHDPDLAFVSLIGIAALHESKSETRGRWKAAYDVYFPSETDRRNAIFVEVEAQRMDLWIRGVTPEPFGLRATVLERDAGGWRLITRLGFCPALSLLPAEQMRLARDRHRERGRGDPGMKGECAALDRRVALRAPRDDDSVRTVSRYSGSMPAASSTGFPCGVLR